MDYLSTLSIDFGLLGPELTLLIAACVILLISPIKKIRFLAPAIGIIAFLIALYVALEQWGHQGSGFAGLVTCDDFGTMFKLIFIVASLLSLLIARRFFEVKGIEQPEFYALLLFSTIGMMVMANTVDLVVMFLGLEIMSVPLYVMAAFNKRSLKSNEAGIKYFFMGAFASAFLLMGIAFVYGAAETTDFRRIVADFNYILANRQAYIFTGAALVLIGFGFKIAAVPFHTWVPDVYQGAPTPVTGFFSVAPKAAGFAVLLRIFQYGFTDIAILSNVLWVLTVLTMTVGNIMALRQNNVKRMLAYSSIAHAGYIMIALTVGGSEAVAAAIFYLVAYTMFNLGAFAIITILETRVGCESDFDELAGLNKTSPYLSAMLALFMFALAGFPPTVGFFGKFYLFSAAVKSGFIWLAIIGVMNSFISVYYYLRVVKTTYMDKYEGKPVVPSVTPALFIVLIITVIGTLGLGFFPEKLLEMTQTAFFGFM